MKKLFLIISSLSLLFGATFFTSFGTPVLIESKESKNKSNEEVFNRISFVPGLKQDIWLMRQSQDGLGLEAKKWDELSIVVDKTTTPFTVSYHQYENGKEIEYRASCYLCHANGPRAIRPNLDSKTVQNSAWEKIKISAMNLRIHTYGKIALDCNEALLNGKERITHLGYDHFPESEVLNVPTCLKCHNEDGFLGRGKLKKQQLSTIDHLTKTKAMPPWPYSLNAEEKRELQSFIHGI